MTQTVRRSKRLKPILDSNTDKVPTSQSPAASSTLRMVVIFCGMLMALSGFSTDIILPAFGAMVVDLNTSLDTVQATIALFALPFGIGQIFFGPASDRFGRRPVINVGLIIFLIGTALATVGSTIEPVLAGRALQGFGAGVAPVLARAILRDTHSGTALARAMALAMAIFSFGPIVAPLIGVFAVESFGWRSTFTSMGLMAIALAAVNHFKLRETNTHLNPNALQPRQIWAAILTVVGNRQSRYFLLFACLAYCALFTYIANAPRIFANQFGMTGLDFALLFAISGLGIILGQSVNRAFLPRLGILAMLRIASLNLVIASVGIGLLSAYGDLQAWQFTMLMFWFNTSFLAIISNTATLCLEPHPKLAGLASAFYGCVTNTTGAAFILLTVGFVGESTFHWAVVMMALTTVTALGMAFTRSSKLQFN